MSKRAVGLAFGVAAALIGVALVLMSDEDDDRLSPNRPAPLTAEQYRRELAAALTHVRLVGSPNDLRALRERADDFHTVVDELADIVPPARAADMHARIVDGMDGYAALLDRYADSGREGLATFEQQLAAGSGASEQKWVQAFNELIAGGYMTYVEPR